MPYLTMIRAFSGSVLKYHSFDVAQGTNCLARYQTLIICVQFLWTLKMLLSKQQHFYQRSNFTVHLHLFSGVQLLGPLNYHI